MSDITETPARKVEYCCDTCLRSTHVLDTSPCPRCERCGTKMTPDSDEPRDRVSVLKAEHQRRKAP